MTNLHLFVGASEIQTGPENKTLIAQLIQNNFDACLSGLEYPDVTIFVYYTNFKVYSAMHNYNVPEEMLRIARNDRDRTFAYCYKIHLAEDGASHNFFVPAAIRKTKLPNYVIHPIQELKIEGRYLDIRSNRMMENHKEFDWLVTQASGIDWSSEADKLNTIIGGGEFYSKAYAPDSTTSWGKFQNYFYKTIQAFTKEDTEVDLVKLMREETRAVLRGETPSLDPSGEKALIKADADTQLWLYGLTFLAIIVIFYLSFRWRIIGFSKEPFKIR